MSEGRDIVGYVFMFSSSAALSLYLIGSEWPLAVSLLHSTYFFLIMVFKLMSIREETKRKSRSVRK